jgi:hypothetical protein
MGTLPLRWALNPCCQGWCLCIYVHSSVGYLTVDILTVNNLKVNILPVVVVVDRSRMICPSFYLLYQSGFKPRTLSTSPLAKWELWTQLRSQVSLLASQTELSTNKQNLSFYRQMADPSISQSECSDSDASLKGRPSPPIRLLHFPCSTGGGGGVCSLHSGLKVKVSKHSMPLSSTF